MAAGLGTRMKSRRPKHLHPLLGQRLVDWVIEAALPLAPSPFVVVCSGDARNELASSLPDGVETAVQVEPRGTGDAAATARARLDGFDGDVLVLPGDSPLVTSDDLGELLRRHRQGGAAATLLSIEPGEPLPYGRVVRGEDGAVRAVVEAADATPEELAIGELNTSFYVFSASALWPALERLDAANAQGELYLTDAIRHIAADGGRIEAWKAGDPSVGLGVNDRAELARAYALLRQRIVTTHMLAGVTVVDPGSTWIEARVEIERDAVIRPFTELRGQTIVGEEAEVGPHVVAVDAEIGRRATVGPFAYLRPGTVLRDGAKAGTFVEVKNSTIGEGAKVPHLSYVGDAEIGEGTNIGAGAITANFPHQAGRPKGRTRIGRNVRTGIHNGFEAPVTIGDGAWIGGGSYITDDVPPDSLAIARARQVTKEGYLRDRERDN